MEMSKVHDNDITKLPYRLESMVRNFVINNSNNHRFGAPKEDDLQMSNQLSETGNAINLTYSILSGESKV
jgi:hypothetical protein